MSESEPGRVVPVARYTAVALGAATAVVLAANPATRWFASLRRRDDPDYPDDVPLLFDVNTEATIPTWFSAGLLLAVAGACALYVVAATAAGAGGGRRLGVLAVVFAGMSLDETVALHERLDSGVTDTLDVEGTALLRHPWVLAGVVLAAALAAVVAWAIATLPARPRRWVALGLGLYVGGALGLEAVSAAVLDAAGDGLAYGAVTLAEEGAEMVGALVVCCALLAALDVRVDDGALRVRLVERFDRSQRSVSGLSSWSQRPLMKPADHRPMADVDPAAMAPAAPATPVLVRPGADQDARDLALLTGADASGMLAAALAAADGELISACARQVAHQPDHQTTVSYRATVRWPDGRLSDETLAACTGHPPEGALVLDDGEARVAVWRFPHDPDLPGLPAACDATAVARVLDDLGLGGGAVHLHTRAYRPRRRAVIEAVGRRGRLFLKVVRPDRVEALHDRHRLLVRCGVPAPQSLGWTPDGILVLQALPGRTLRHALRSRTTPIPSGGEILALLDRLPAELAAGTPRRSWLDKATHYAAVIGAALPSEAERSADLARSLAAEAQANDGIVPVHGDLYEAQLLVDRGRISGLLDVDTTGPGERLDDLACLLGHLSVLAQIDRNRAPMINRAGAGYLAAFDAAASPVKLRYRVAAVVVSLATGSHRVQERGWPATTRRRLELAEAWLASARDKR